jgi:hypothetical protein
LKAATLLEDITHRVANKPKTESTPTHATTKYNTEVSSVSMSQVARPSSYLMGDSNNDKNIILNPFEAENIFQMPPPRDSDLSSPEC